MKNLDLTDTTLLDHSLVVSASAGSGKTFTLSVLVTAILGKGDVRPFDILATTFSEAASADLRERLLRPLDLLAGFDETTWAMVLPEPASAAWDALALGERTGRARGEVQLAARFWADAPWKASPKKACAFWRRIRREAELMEVSTLHALALRLLSQRDGAPTEIVEANHPALLRLLRASAREVLSRNPGDADHFPAAMLLKWAERAWDELSRGHDAHRDALGHLEPSDHAQHRETCLRALGQAEAHLAPFGADPLLALDANSRTRRFFQPKKILPVPGPDADLPTRCRWAERQSRMVYTEEMPAYYSPAFVVAMATLSPVADAWEAWLGALLVDVFRHFEAAKARHGCATFGDLVREALQGLQDGTLTPPRPRWLLVDEFQDTSRSQDAFLEALDAAQIVRVGDVKQAIYGFRGGDPTLLREQLQRAGAHAYRLPANFRSAPPIVALTNRFVDEVWPELDPSSGDPDGHQEAVACGSWPVGWVEQAGPDRGSDLPALLPWVLALSRPEGWDTALGHSGGERTRRRALLLQARTHLPELLMGLVRAGIRPYVQAREGFWESPGVRLMMCALEAVAYPQRPLPCAALLRHLVGLTDGELTALKPMPGLASIAPEGLPPHHKAGVEWLRSLRTATPQALASSLLAQGALLRSITACRAHGPMEPTRARRNLGGFLSLLAALPACTATAFAMLDELRQGVEKGDLPATESDADLVIQTVHASKGLEYDDVMLPLLNQPPHPLKTGTCHTDPSTGTLKLVWKLGAHPGKAYQQVKAEDAARRRRDALNLFYVALTRARERMCLLAQTRKSPAPTWASWGQRLAERHRELRVLDQPPASNPAPMRPAMLLQPPISPRQAPPRMAAEPDQGGRDRVEARRNGTRMHAYLQDLLVRWEDEQAFGRCLDAPPDIPHAKTMALTFLEAFERRGWRHLPRRTEYPLPGGAASGTAGRADLVVWAVDRIHLLDFKHSFTISEEALATYQQQLRAYARALAKRFGCPVEAWLVALRSAEWLPMEVTETDPGAA